MVEKKVKIKQVVENNFLYPRLRYSWDMALCIWDFINLIGIHKSELKESRNKELMAFMKYFHNKHDFNPGGVLKDYIYLEAHSFFHYAKKLKNRNDKNMPDLPSYMKELKEFRDSLIAHRDYKEKRKFPGGWLKYQEDIHNLISAEQLVKDIDNYYQEVVRRQESSIRSGNPLKR